MQFYILKKKKVSMIVNLELFLLILFSAFIQSTFGFGFNLFFLAIGSIFFSSKLLMPFCILLAVFVDMFLMISTFKYRPKKYYDFIFFGILASPLGLWLYFLMNSRVFDPILGILLILSIILLINNKVSIPNSNPLRSGFGFFIGSIAGAFGISGPFISMMLLSDKNLSPKATIFLMNLFFSGISIVSIIVFYYKGVYSLIDLSNLIYMIMIALIGFGLGYLVREKFSHAIYKHIILFLIFISALFLIAS